MNEEHFNAHLKEHLIDRLGVSMYNRLHHRLRVTGVDDETLRQAIMLEQLCCADHNDDQATIMIHNTADRTQVQVLAESITDFLDPPGL